MCAAPITEAHSHVANIDSRAILCTCRSCYLLFTQQGAGAGKHQAVPERYLYRREVAGAGRLWDTTGIPVRMAFFFTNSATDTTVAFYPSPAGATECLLPIDSWTDLLTGNPGFGDVQPDVEALLVNRAGDGFEGFLVPVDACYHLVGLVRTHWKGFDGGSEAWRHIERFFTDLRERGTALGGGNG